VSKKYVVPSIFTAVDKFSGPVNKMSRSAESSMARMERKSRKISDRAFSISRQSAMMGAAIIAPLALATREAVKFESAMADVAKVANVEIGSSQFKQLGDQAKALGIDLGTSSEEAAGLMANLAQGGVAIKDLDRVSRIAGKMGVAFGISGDLAGEAFIKTRNALGGTIKQTEAVMDTINMFGNTTAAASDQLVNFMAKGGSSVARVAEASGSELAAFGSQFISMGKSAEISATIMQRFIKTTMQNKQLRPVFEEAGGGAAGMMAIIEKGSKLSGKAQDEYFSNFGEYGLQIQLLAKNFDGLESKINASRDATANAGSVQKEFENRTNTSGFKLEQMKTRLTNVAISLGEALIPLVSKAVEKITPLIEKFSTWVSENRGTVKTIMKVAAAVGGLALAVSAVSGIVGIATKAFAIYKYGVIAFNAVVKAARIAQIAWNAAMSANPLGLFIGVAVAAGAAVAALSSEFSSQTRAQRLNNEVQKRALDNTIDQRVEMDLLFGKLKKLNPESESYKNNLAKLERLQPGVTKQYNLQKGAIDDLTIAHKDLIEQMDKKAERDAAQQMLTESSKNILELEQKLKTQKDQGAFSEFIQGFGDYDNTKTRLIERLAEAREKRTMLRSRLNQDIPEEDKRVANPDKARQDGMRETVENTTKEQIELTMGEDLKGLLNMNRGGNGGASGVSFPYAPTTN
jgi:TP901 family phage tail tape measure protein